MDEIKQKLSNIEGWEWFNSTQGNKDCEHDLDSISLELADSPEALLGRWKLIHEISECVDGHLECVGLSKLKRSLFKRAKPVTEIKCVHPGGRDKNNELNSISIKTSSMGRSMCGITPINGEICQLDDEFNKMWTQKSFWDSEHKCFVQYRTAEGMPVFIDIRYVFSSDKVLNALKLKNTLHGNRICLFKWLVIDDNNLKIHKADRWLMELSASNPGN